MSAQTAARALEELREAGLLDSDHLCIRVYAIKGEIGKLRSDIDNGQNTLLPNGKEERAYLTIVAHLTPEDIVILGDMLKNYYLKLL